MSTLKSLGERSIIRKIRSKFSYKWPDDDASVIDIGREYLLVTTDSISKKSHMPSGAKMRSVGYFFAALNLSDIAAMGGTPRYFMASMVLPADMELKDLLHIEEGIRDCLKRYGAKLIGGDLKQGDSLTMSGVAIGFADKKKVMRRQNVRPNDIVCITGELGRNAAGFYMWKKTGNRKWAEMLLDIEPRVKEGLLIAKSGGSAAIDLSDGLFSAVSQLNKLTGLGFELDFSQIPVSRTAKTVSASLRIPIEKLAFNFGGEYELLFTISNSRFKKLAFAAARRGIRITNIGRIHGNKNVLLKYGGKTAIKDKGYEHFSTGHR